MRNYEDMLEQIRLERQKYVEANRARINQCYGERTDEEIWSILKAERELKICEGCPGLPCRNVNSEEIIPSIGIEDGKLVIRYGACTVSRLAHAKSRQERLLKSARIPTQYVGKTFGDYRVDKLNREAVEWAKSAVKSGAGAFLYGERGTGKTFLASIVAQELIRAGKSTVFIKVPALLGNIRDTFNGKGNFTEEQLMREASTCPVLILDDFGMEKPTRFAGTTLCQIIDSRYDAGLQTIVTSNYDLETIQHELDNAIDGKNYNGSRIVDRLAAMGNIILFKGLSRR